MEVQELGWHGEREIDPDPERRRLLVEQTERIDQIVSYQRQRAAVARALVTKPDCILADEPTGNLDPVSAEKVMKTLNAYHRDGATIMIASHHTLEYISPDMKIRLTEGKLSEIG